MSKSFQVKYIANNDFILSTNWRLTSKESDLLRAIPGVQSVCGQNYEHVITLGRCFNKTAHEILKMCEDCLVGEKPKPFQLEPEHPVVIRKYNDKRDGDYHPNCVVFCLSQKIDEDFKRFILSCDGVIDAQIPNQYTMTVRFSEAFTKNELRLCHWMTTNLNNFNS